MSVKVAKEMSRPVVKALKLVRNWDRRPLSGTLMYSCRADWQEWHLRVWVIAWHGLYVLSFLALDFSQPLLGCCGDFPRCFETTTRYLPCHQAVLILQPIQVALWVPSCPSSEPNMDQLTGLILIRCLNLNRNPETQKIFIARVSGFKLATWLSSKIRPHA